MGSCGLSRVRLSINKWFIVNHDPSWTRTRVAECNTVPGPMNQPHPHSFRYLGAVRRTIPEVSRETWEVFVFSSSLFRRLSNSRSPGLGEVFVSLSETKWILFHYSVIRQWFAIWCFRAHPPSSDPALSSPIIQLALRSVPRLFITWQ